MLKIISVSEYITEIIRLFIREVYYLLVIINNKRILEGSSICLNDKQELGKFLALLNVENRIII